MWDPVGFWYSAYLESYKQDDVVQQAITWELPVELFLEVYDSRNNYDQEAALQHPQILELHWLAHSVGQIPNNHDANSKELKLIEALSSFLKNFCPDSDNYDKVGGKGKEFLDSIFYNSYELSHLYAVGATACSNFKKEVQFRLADLSY